MYFCPAQGNQLLLAAQGQRLPHLLPTKAAGSSQRSQAPRIHIYHVLNAKHHSAGSVRLSRTLASSGSSQAGLDPGADDRGLKVEGGLSNSEEAAAAWNGAGAGAMQYPGDRSGLLSGIERGSDDHDTKPRQQQVNQLQHTAHWAVSLSALYAIDKLVANAAHSAGITFPPPLIGMFIIVAALWGSSAVSGQASKSVLAFFKPALDWIQKWLPLFYVPTLITLPLSLYTFNGVDLAKILGLIVVGMPVTLLVTAYVAIMIRHYSNTEVEPPEPTSPPEGFSKLHYYAWGVTSVLSLAAVAFSSSAEVTRWASSVFMLASTVGGYLVGSSFPAHVTQLLHPMITTAVMANFAAVIMGGVTGAGFQETLRGYLTKNPAKPGGGDWLMSFLGVVILSFGFKIFSQRRLMVRHAREIFGSTIASAAFSIYATAFAAKAVGLAPDLCRALVPRSVTVALALPMAAQLHAPAAITVAGVAISGLLGANFGQAIMTRFKFKDPIARGLAQAGAAHGLGTAAIATNEPEALPFCALAYALIGIISTVLVSIGPVRASILAITA